MSVFVQQQHSVCDFTGSDSWVILSEIEQSIKRKIEAVGTPLKDWDIQINYGIKTGYNDAFIITTEKRDEILAKCITDEERQRTAELIRPILRGRDIKRYGYEWANLWLIATFPARQYDINNYPAVKNYLLSFAKQKLIDAGYSWVANDHLADFCKQKLSQTGKFIEIDGKRITLRNSQEKARKKTSNKWFETQDSISYWEDFSKPKIVFQEIVQEGQFTLDTIEHFMCNDTCRIIVGNDISFLIGILNSKLFFFAIKTYYGGGGLGEHAVRMKHTFFGLFHCIRVDDMILSLVHNRLITNDVSIERKINNRIYELYNLSKEEILFIENSHD